MVSAQGVRLQAFAREVAWVLRGGELLGSGFGGAGSSLERSGGDPVLQEKLVGLQESGEPSRDSHHRAHGRLKSLISAWLGACFLGAMEGGQGQTLGPPSPASAPASPCLSA